MGIKYFELFIIEIRVVISEEYDHRFIKISFLF